MVAQLRAAFYTGFEEEGVQVLLAQWRTKIGHLKKKHPRGQMDVDAIAAYETLIEQQENAQRNPFEAFGTPENLNEGAGSCGSNVESTLPGPQFSACRGVLGSQQPEGGGPRPEGALTVHRRSKTCRQQGRRRR